jgi:hypothetical protein
MMRVKNHQSPATIRVENALNKTILANHGFTEDFYYTVKKVSDFPVLSRDVTYQILPGRE